jgi:hypothetical protein
MYAFTLILMLIVMPCQAFAGESWRIDFSRWDNTELARAVATANHDSHPGDRTVVLSEFFVDAPYVANTLIGSPMEAEQLVINPAGFDCFTFLDVVEALRRTAVPDDFPAQLQQVRYHDGVVAYEKRRHFFSDWVVGDAVVSDVTISVGQGHAQSVLKQLNRKSDQSKWLPGIPVTSREINYIPTHWVDEKVLSALQAGDYVGIYSDQDGLDVSHTGLIAKSNDMVFLRHASSQSGEARVTDSGLLEYLQGKPGLLVYRFKP